MMRSFTLRSPDLVAADGNSVLDEVLRHTGSEVEAHSILRSVERFGGDSSIRYFEVTPKTVQRTHRGAAPVSWTVTAVRP